MAQIELKSATIKNESADGEHRFTVVTPNGDKHVFKPATVDLLREWLLDLEAGLLNNIPFMNDSIDSIEFL